MMRGLLRVAGQRLGLLAIVVVCQFAHVVGSLWMIAAALGGSDRYWRIARGYDRMGNAVTGGLDTETVSSRILDWIEKDHCSKSEGI